MTTYKGGTITNEQQAHLFHEAAGRAEFLAEKLLECAKYNPYAPLRLARAKQAQDDASDYRGHKSGLVPEGDVRLTANIREDLHLKLKIEAAKRRTTVGEMIEQMIERL